MLIVHTSEIVNRYRRDRQICDWKTLFIKGECNRSLDDLNNVDSSESNEAGDVCRTDMCSPAIVNKSTSSSKVVLE